MIEKPDWILDTVTLTAEARRQGARAYYRFHVEGHNLSDGGRSFSWTVRDLDDPRFCLADARVAPDAAQLLRDLHPALFLKDAI